MKKVILVVLLALNVYGNEALCNYFVEKYSASNKMLYFAVDNGNYKDIAKYAKKSLSHLERASSECNNKSSEAAVQKSREQLKAIIADFQ